jgi:RND family efflux transporter MFP subunit
LRDRVTRPTSVSTSLRALFAGALVIAPAALLAVGCEESKSAEPPRPRPVRYATIASGTSDDSRMFSATVQARDATQLSFRVGGILARLNVKLGGQVEKGALIGQLDASDYRVALAQAQANYQNAKTQTGVAQSAFRRVEKLYEAGSASLSDYENAKGQLDSARAQLAASGQQVQQARNQLDYTKLVAPFDGVVNSVPVKVGEQIGAGRTIAVVSRGGELEIGVGVPEGMISRIQVGSAAQVHVAAQGEQALSGTVREVGFASESSTYPVRIELDEAPEALRPGMAADVRFDLGTRSAALAVPSSAVGNAESGSYVFLLEPSGEAYAARKRPVKLGPLIGDDFEVVDGLSAGDKIATAGLSQLVDGMTVRLLDRGEGQP